MARSFFAGVAAVWFFAQAVGSFLMEYGQRGGAGSGNPSVDAINAVAMVVYVGLATLALALVEWDRIAL